MAKHLISRILLLCAAALIAGCGPRSDDTTPDMAQRLLQLRGYYFTTQDFYKAIKLHDGRAVKAFIQGGMDPNVPNSTGQTPLTYALEFTDASMIEPLMDNADLGRPDPSGNTPVYLALKFDHTEIFEKLLENNVDINSSGRNKNVKNQTILSLAVQKGDVGTVRKLLEKGADVNISDDNGFSPLMAAVTGEKTDPEIVKMLLDKGADPNHQGTSRGATPMIYTVVNAAMPFATRIEVIKLLLAKNADPNKQETGNGYTALMYAYLDGRSVPEERIQMIKFLLENGANKTVKTAEGETVVEWAKKNNEPEITALLR